MSTAIMEDHPVPPSAPATATPEPPRDRGIWVVANMIDRDEFGSRAEGYEGYARFDDKSGDWLNLRGLPIRQYLDSEFRILSWIECAERAKDCPDTETETTANIYCWDDEVRREQGRAGFFAVYSVHHSATLVRLVGWRNEGSFATRAEAVAVLTRMMSAPIHGEPAS